jgi:hypothetical protein
VLGAVGADDVRREFVFGLGRATYSSVIYKDAIRRDYRSL